eukprot:scaffold5989_cov94-Cylindrotheca_fusiformis.AAC.2
MAERSDRMAKTHIMLFKRRRIYHHKCLAPLFLAQLVFYWNLAIHLFDDMDATSAKSSRNKSSWNFRNESSEWCYPEKGIRKHPGLLFVKVPKTASSTLAGINIRIARNVGQRSMRKGFFVRNDPVCSHSFYHGRELLMQRESPHQLTWSFVRDPASRAQSAFYHFEVSRKGVWPTIGHLINYMSQESTSNFQFSYLATHPNPKQLLEPSQHSNEQLRMLVRDYILNEYDFLGIVERWTESLAAMILLWNLHIGDVIVLPSKLAGGYDDGRYQSAGCVKIQKIPIAKSEDDVRYLGSYLNTTFHQENQLDYQLYQLSNEMLDSTIQKLGSIRSVRQLPYFRARLMGRGNMTSQRRTAIGLIPDAGIPALIESLQLLTQTRLGMSSAKLNMFKHFLLKGARHGKTRRRLFSLLNLWKTKPGVSSEIARIA